MEVIISALFEAEKSSSISKPSIAESVLEENRHTRPDRSCTSSGNDLKWSKILTVPGAGNSTTQLSYYDKDREPLTGISYYRLKQVDFDGQYTYSDVVSVLNTTPQDRDEVFMFPNPSNNGSMYLRIPAVATKCPTQVRIFDLQGKSGWQGSFELDNDLMEVKYGNLNSGIYLVEIKSEILYESKKLVVQGN